MGRPPPLHSGNARKKTFFFYWCLPLVPVPVILWHYICVTIERDFGCSMSIFAFFCRMGFQLVDIVQALKGLGLPDWRASDFWDSGFSDPVGRKHSHRLPRATTKGEDWALLSTWNLPHWQQSGFLKRIYWPQGKQSNFSHININQESPVFLMKNIRPVNNGRLIISGAGLAILNTQRSHPILEGKDKTTLNIIGWQGDVFKGTNVSKVGRVENGNANARTVQGLSHSRSRSLFGISTWRGALREPPKVMSERWVFGCLIIQG